MWHGDILHDGHMEGLVACLGREPIWRSSIAQISLRLIPEVSSSPIYILSAFWRIWRSGEGRPKLEGLAASEGGGNSSSWRGFGSALIRFFYLQLDILVGGL